MTQVSSFTVRLPNRTGYDRSAHLSESHVESMKKGIHPNYRHVVFQDTSCGFRFLTKSTVRTNQTTTWEDGNEYPLFVLDVSSASHPFYTGAGNRFVDAAGRIDRFNKRFGNNYGSKKKKAAE
jgi:large subunit ribosomal protein L31